jgi:hypothetical protein
MLLLIMLGFYCGLIVATFLVINKLNRLRYKINKTNNNRMSSHKKQ